MTKTPCRRAHSRIHSTVPRPCLPHGDTRDITLAMRSKNCLKKGETHRPMFRKKRSNMCSQNAPRTSMVPLHSSLLRSMVGFLEPSSWCCTRLKWTSRSRPMQRQPTLLPKTGIWTSLASWWNRMPNWTLEQRTEPPPCS